MRWRRSVAIGGALALAVLAFDAHSVAQAYWCANYQTGGTNCGFSTFAQCQASVSGIGGGCNEIRDSAPARTVREPREEVSRPRRTPEPKATKVTPRQPESSPPAAAPVAAPKPATASAPAAMPPAVTPQRSAAFVQARQLILGGQYEAGLAGMRALNSDNHPDIATYVGLANLKLGRIEEAKSWYERALTADPNNKLALSFYGMLRVEQGDIAGAQASLVRIGRICGNINCNEYQALQGVIAARIR